MKLWLKQTLPALFIVLISVSTCLILFTAMQTDNLLRQAEESGQRSLEAFCEHLSALDQNSYFEGNTDATTRAALIQYTFSSYAHLLQSAENSYSLAGEAGYLYNISPLHPLALLPFPEGYAGAQRTILMDDNPFIIHAKPLLVLDTNITVYLTQNIAQTYQDIAHLTRTAQLSLGACLLLCGVLLPLIFRKSLRPLKKLTYITRRIADGQYALRAEIRTSDEVGELSNAFDAMAETVEQKIVSLEDTAKRRELMLGALTHEMKTPMTAIIGYAQSLLSMPLSEEARMDATHEIYNAARRTERLSQKMMQLIALNESGAIIKKACDIEDLFVEVKRAADSFLHEKKITLTMSADTNALYGDKDLLFTMLTNLIHNAVHASAEGAGVALDAKRLAGAVRLSVADTGFGIPPDKLRLVTEPFYRVDKARSRKLGGAGLGLSLCKMIAEAHGAQLVIESALGEGTVICVDLPDDGEGKTYE